MVKLFYCHGDSVTMVMQIIVMVILLQGNAVCCHGRIIAMMMQFVVMVIQGTLPNAK